MQLSISKQYLELFKRNLQEFLHRVTINETWIHYYTPKPKEQLKEWTSCDERIPKNAKTFSTAGKGLFFWNPQGIIFIDYMKKKKAITG